MRKLGLVFAACFIGTCLGYSGSAYACPDGQSQGAFGWCYPNIGGDVGKSWEHAKKEVSGQILGNPLAVWIQQSRDNSSSGAQPIPFGVRSALTGYVSDDVLNRSRYKMDDNGILNVAHTIQHLDGGVGAVTLDNLIVFRGPSEASDISLWAHELKHVEQYRDWGIRDFAINYMRDYNAVEAPAYAQGNAYYGWAAARNVSPNYPQFGTPAPAVVPASVCVAPPAGICQLGVPLARGNFCICYTQFGQFAGQAQ